MSWGARVASHSKDVPRTHIYTLRLAGFHPLCLIERFTRPDSGSRSFPRRPASVPTTPSPHDSESSVCQPKERSETNQPRLLTPLPPWVCRCPCFFPAAWLWARLLWNYDLSKQDAHLATAMVTFKRLKYQNARLDCKDRWHEPKLGTWSLCRVWFLCSFLHSFICLFHKYFWKAPREPGTCLVLGWQQWTG